ncbi:MAG: nuclear transport factor 2 family protein [Actinomycetota bacterium]|nr:nuclear transport factor 2 family protein [Actinomycetota bacterium]
MSQDDVQRLREGYEAFNAGDWERVIASFAPDFTSSDRPDLLDAERDVEPARAMERAGAQFDDYRLDPLRFEDGEDWVLVTVRQSGRGKVSGVPVEEELFHLWDVRGGRAVQLRAFSTKEEALAVTGWSAS